MFHRQKNMNIGIYLGNNLSETGGGFTFQEDIIRAILAHETVHKFFIFCPKREELRSSNPNVKIIALKNGHLDKIARRLVKIWHKACYSLLGVNLFPYKSGFDSLLKKHKIDLLWFVTPEYEDTEIPFIITVWDLQHRLQPFFPEVSVGYDGYEWERRERYYRSILPRAAYILTGTQEGKHELMRFYNISEDRIKVLPLPTPAFTLRENDNRIKPELKLPDKYLFYPAQFWPHKNHIILLYAIKILKEKHHLNFAVVFSGSDKGNLQYIKDKTKELNLTKKVFFPGFVTREELVRLYKNAFALVFPSLFGPDNLPPLEAMACGCPVIAGDVAGAKEQLADAALLVNHTSEKEVAYAINLLFRNNNLREKLIKKGYERAVRWTSGNYMKSIYKILDEFKLYRRCWM